MKPQRICHITTVHTTFDVRIFHKECRSLAAAGYEVYLVAKAQNDQLRDGVQIVALQLSQNRFKNIIAAYHKARRLAADVYHFHDPELMPAGVLLKLTTRAKIMYDVHEDVQKHAQGKSWWQPWQRQLFAFILNSIERFSQYFFDQIICAEDSYLSKFSRPKTVIHNYPLLTEHGPAVGHASQPALIYVGTMRKKRGLFEMIELIDRLKASYPQIQLTLAGPFFPVELESQVRQNIEAAGLESNIEITGRLDHSQIFAYIRKANIGLALLHPDANYVHSLPTKMFEYMMFGLPVVVSDFPLWRKIVEKEDCGRCVNALDVQAIAATVSELLTDESLRKKMGERGQKAVQEKYHWQIEEKRLIECYQNLI